MTNNLCFLKAGPSAWIEFRRFTSAMEHSQVSVCVFQYSRDRSVTPFRVWTGATATSGMEATPVNANMDIGGSTVRKVAWHYTKNTSRTCSHAFIKHHYQNTLQICGLLLKLKPSFSASGNMPLLVMLFEIMQCWKAYDCTYELWAVFLTDDWNCSILARIYLLWLKARVVSTSRIPFFLSLSS